MFWFNFYEVVCFDNDKILLVFNWVDKFNRNLNNCDCKLGIMILMVIKKGVFDLYVRLVEGVVVKVIKLIIFF